MTEAAEILDAEVWRTVAGWPAYKVSNHGRVRGQQGTVLAPKVHTHGYLRVSLSENGRVADAYIHRLVCEAFNAPCPPGHECDHVNKVRDDNRPENLRWVTPEENKADRDFARGDRNGCAKLSSARVDAIKRALPRLTNSEIAAIAGVARRTIADIRNGVTWK